MNIILVLKNQWKVTITQATMLHTWFTRYDQTEQHQNPWKCLSPYLQQQKIPCNISQTNYNFAKSTLKEKLHCNTEGVEKHRRHNNLTRNLISFPFTLRRQEKKRLNAIFHLNCAWIEFTRAVLHSFFALCSLLMVLFFSQHTMRGIELKIGISSRFAMHPYEPINRAQRKLNQFTKCAKHETDHE